MTQIGQPKRIIEIPLPEERPSEPSTEPLEEPATPSRPSEPQPTEPVPV